jgi:hypothetical protein
VAKASVSVVPYESPNDAGEDDLMKLLSDSRLPRPVKAQNKPANKGSRDLKLFSKKRI